MYESSPDNNGLIMVLGTIILIIGIPLSMVSPAPFNFIFICITLFMVGSLIYNRFISKKFTSSVDFVEKFIKEASVKYDDYIISDDTLGGIAINEHDGKLYILERKNAKSDYTIKDIDFKSVLESGIVEDEQTLTKTSKAGLVGGSLLGNVLFGGVGAIVGGMSASKTSTEQVKKVTLNIVVDDLMTPIREIVFFKSDYPVKKSNTKYQINFQKCNMWHKRMSVIVNRN